MVLNPDLQDAKAMASTMWPVVEAVGLDAALVMAREYGGMSLYIRKEPRDDDPLVLLLGFDAARAVCQRLGHGLFTVPKCQALANARRNADILARYRGGEYVNDLVLRYGLHRAQLFRILAGGDGAAQPGADAADAAAPQRSAAQLPLFDLHQPPGRSAGQET